MKPIITAEKFINSLSVAFAYTNDFNVPAKRARERYNKCRPGSLHIKTNHRNIYFFEYVDGKQIPLLKSNPKIYAFARKRYLGLLVKLLDSFVLQSPQSNNTITRQLTGKYQIKSATSNLKLHTIERKRNKLFQQLSDLIYAFEAGNLDLARIVLTQKQYNWFMQPFRQKPFRTSEYADSRFQGKQIFYTKSNVAIHSKSECNIGNGLEDFAVCYHYEEQMQLFVKPLVFQLTDLIREYCRNHGLRGDYNSGNRFNLNKLYSYQNGACCWNVPDVLQWMNSNGSLWKTYNSNTGKVTMYNDFTMMMADDSLMKWEHEGLLEDFMYRQNAKERASLMIATGNIDRKNLIETCEAEANDVERLIDIIKRDVLPRLWY